ncbi:uncharacterized protein LOC108112712 [Drosophila eugracilis]|uniref:uncharacterized protein LOC108112712 n=1 Tax=Drosophila eugracilis TaxID=29029 RepID=UPI001BD9417C|nr:uncharacterized protein LOC108112712 [Drosophila eugracilis]
MGRNLENSLNHANGNYVNFDEHREKYTTHYNALRNKVYSEWKGAKVLGKLVNGCTLGGGYGDNLKVSNPDEFDLVIHLSFPENDKIIVKGDPRKPGNVILDMTKVMEIIGNQEHNKPVFELLQKIVNNKNQLLEDKLQSLLQGVMTQTLKKMGGQIEVGGVVSPLSYKKCGPAHTIFVRGDYEYSVDFVPAIRLSAAQVFLDSEQRKHFGSTPYWDAIPKPMKPALPNNVSFRASFYDAERTLLHGKDNLKNAIRLLKQHRNVKNKANLKSYYIKTLFLWEVKERHDSYWQKPLKEITIDMLGKLEKSLAVSPRKGKLLFFWDPKLDMLADLTVDQRADMYNCVCKVGYTFRRADGNLTDDIENTVQTSFCASTNKGAENKPANGQGEKTRPMQKQCSAKKNIETETEVKVPTPAKANEKKSSTVPTISNPKANEAKGQTSEKPKSAEAQTGIKPKSKLVTDYIKPNPKPNEKKAANVDTPSPVSVKNTNPNGIGEKPKTNANKRGDSKQQQTPDEKKKEDSKCLIN